MQLELRQLGRNYDFPDGGISHLLVLLHINSKRDMVGGTGLERACRSQSLQQARQLDSFSASDNKIAVYPSRCHRRLTYPM